MSGLRWGIGLALAAIILTRFDVAEVGENLRGTDLRLALPAIAGLVAVQVVGAATWRALAHRLGSARMAWAATIRTYYVAQAIGLLTPGNLGADAYRLFTPAEGTWRSGLLPIALQRVTSSVGVAIVAIGALALIPGSTDLAPVVVGSAVGLALASSAVLLVLRRPGLRGSPAAASPASPAPSSTPSQAEGPSLRVMLGAGASGLGYALVFHAVSIGLTGLLVASIAPEAPMLQVLGCLAIARLSILVPISPSGLGFQEGALSILFVRIGLPPEVALASAALNRVSLLATASLGGVLVAIPRVRRLVSSKAAPGRTATTSTTVAALDR